MTMIRRILPLIRKLAPACVFVAASISAPAQAQLVFEISGSRANRIAVSVASFEGEQALPRAVTDVVRADLERSGLFKLVELGPSLHHPYP